MLMMRLKIKHKTIITDIITDYHHRLSLQTSHDLRMETVPSEELSDFRYVCTTSHVKTGSSFSATDEGAESVFNQSRGAQIRNSTLSFSLVISIHLKSNTLKKINVISRKRHES